MASPVDPTALLQEVDKFATACLDASQGGAELRRMHAAGEVLLRLVVDQAQGVILLIAVNPQGQELTPPLVTIKRRTFVPPAFQEALPDEDDA